MDEAAKAGMTTEEIEAKRKARLERFGASEVEDAESILKKKGGFKQNRRNQKFNRKQQ